MASTSLISQVNQCTTVCGLKDLARSAGFKGFSSFNKSNFEQSKLDLLSHLQEPSSGQSKSPKPTTTMKTRGRVVYRDEPEGCETPTDIDDDDDDDDKEEPKHDAYYIGAYRSRCVEKANMPTTCQGFEQIS